MGTFAEESLYTNHSGGAGTNPKAGQGLAALRENQIAIRELPGALPEMFVEILDGVITPAQAALVVDTEGQAPADELTTLATTTIHAGAEITLRAADASRSITLVHSSGPGGMQLRGGADKPLSPDTETRFRLRDGIWYEMASVRADGETILDEGGVLSAAVATAEKPGIGRPDNVTLTNAAGIWSVRDAWVQTLRHYELCEFYYFRHPDLKPGFFPAMGGLLENAPAQCPQAWEYLQTEEGRKLCVTEADWQAMVKAIWHTNADGTTVGWNGIGGAPWYVQDLDAGTLRLPDLRGMYAEAAGFDSLGVGGGHLDGIRNITGEMTTRLISSDPSPSGAFIGSSVRTGGTVLSNSYAYFGSGFNASRVVPIANQTQPRAWGALACVYLGQPAS